MLKYIFNEQILIDLFGKVIEEKNSRGKIVPHFFNFTTYVLNTIQCDPNFYELWVEKLLQNDEVAIRVFAHFFNNLTDPNQMKDNLFFKHLIQAGVNNVHLQCALLIAGGKFTSSSSFIDTIEKSLVKLIPAADPLLQTRLKNLKRAYNRIILDLLDFENQTLAAVEETFSINGSTQIPDSGDYFSFSQMPPLYQFRLIQGLMHRKVELLNFFLKGPNPAKFKDQLHDESKSHSKNVLMCPRAKEKELMHSLSSKAEEVGITIHVIAPHSIKFNEETFKKMKGVSLIKGALAPTLWVRDFIFEFQNSYRFPPFMKVSTEYRYHLYRERKKRVGKETLFSNLGANIRDAPHLHLFEYVEKIDQKLNRGQKTTFFQFLNYEGGNVFFGNSKGQDYVVIGKDTLGINRINLQYELAELGLQYHENRWILTDPYDSKLRSSRDFRGNIERARIENNKNLSPISDKLLKDLMHLDFGCEEIFLVEQPEYHLDVASALFDSENKKVFVNDSILALHIMERYLEQIPQDKISDKVKPILEIRLEKARKYARSMIDVEDQVEKDFESQGFQVVRIPGIFREEHQEHPESHCINFFNFMPFRNKEGLAGLFALGSPPYFQNLYKEIIHKYMPEIKEIFFIPEKESKDLLFKKGGLHGVMSYLD